MKKQVVNTQEAQACVLVEDVPGLVMKDGKPHKEVGGVLLPVKGVLRTKGGGYIPVLDVNWMEDKPKQTQAAG